MSAPLYKKKISDSLNSMDAATLKQAWLILKEIDNGKKIPPVSGKKKLESQLAKGIQQLESGEGTDMTSFVSGLKRKYGKNKS